MSEDDFRRAITNQQRAWDEQMADFRQYYEAHTPEQRAKMRAWFEKTKAVCHEGLHDWGFLSRVRLEQEETDDEGNTTDLRVIELSPWTCLDAITAWDKGLPYDPKCDGVPPP